MAKRKPTRRPKASSPKASSPTGRTSSRRKPAKVRGVVLAQVAAGLALLAVAGGGWMWWTLRHWQPTRLAYPTQGVEVGVDDGEVDWTAIKATGADFAYVDASDGVASRDTAVVANLDGVRAAHLPWGALHKYDPCQTADKQAANFVTVVPRDPRMLPPAVELDRLADACPTPVNDAAVLSELMVFLNQIETHTGKPAILKLGSGFEARYHVAQALKTRNLWLVGDRIVPDYAGRPWAMWTANGALMSPAVEHTLRWVVVQP